VIDAVKTVLSGFIGIRRKADHERAALKPLHVVFAAISLVIVFIVILVTIVRVVTS
jgi:hypothetical protein